MRLETWTIYLVAVLGLSLTPGPNSLLVMAHGALHGWRRTVWTIAGGAVGFALLIALSMTGIAALLAAAPSALRVLKVLGGAYLVWLGVQLWRSPPVRIEPATPDERGRSSASLFRQGLLAAVANPKVLLFYGAFLPQFLDPGRGMGVQFVHLAATFVLVEACVEGLIAGLAFRVRAWLSRSGKAFNRACGSFFVALGAALPFTG